MDRATVIFNTLLARASKTPRNFIIYLTNVYKSALVVFPRPEDLKSRSA
ncbi:hypothetical protein Ccrd_024202 [Cynara cardunculus var. scolymus]|uniref:Uncharacterized protein n=1 Tax=Cynara cardunculus var. scolymus TaxID=59895 RepID=A0A118DD61_CYNCS|nr:hypothetical protein Ccrd_024202 [Cynara cardunculus var. scolymus]